MATIGLVWAQAANRVIGRDGLIPWRLPEDMAHFRSLTAGATVVMGRRTWESLPARFRPLPGRRNVVLTRNRHWRAEGAAAVPDLAEALRADTDVWVIGGGEVYRAALQAADLAVITELREQFDGDTFAPRLEGAWQQLAREPATGWHTSSTGLHYRVLRMARTTPGVVTPAG